MQSAQFELHADIEERHWWFLARRRILRSLVGQLVSPGDEATIVDVGCGTGGNLAALANEYRCVGIDTSAEAIELARLRFPNVPFLCGMAPDDLGELSGQASLFLLMDVLEHVPDDFAMLSSLLAAARPGAQILLTVPADARLWSEHDVSFGHYRRYDRKRLACVWQGLPVRLRLLSYFNTRLYPLVRLVRTANRLRGRASGSQGTDFRVPHRVVNRTLERIFAGESGRLVDQMDRPNAQPYGRGVSLVAVLEREAGTIETRCRPADVAPDLHNPAAFPSTAAAV